MRLKQTGFVPSQSSGFTLLELIIVISIMAILLLAVVLVLDPLERIAEADDSARQQDMRSIVDAMALARDNGLMKELGGFDPDAALTNRCVGESNQTVFVSVLGTDASGTCDSPPDDLPTGWTYRCAPSDGPGDVDGTGWLPLDFTAGGASSPLSHMPSDSANTFASNFYYTYVCDRSGSYEITARMVSNKFRTGGGKDIQSTDGGDDVYVYETGTDLSLDPKAPIGAWQLDGGTSGAIADMETAGFEDSAGNHDGVFTTDGGAAWVSGRLNGALSVDEGDYSVVLDDPSLSSPRLSVTMWFMPTGSGSLGSMLGKYFDADDSEMTLSLGNPGDQFRCVMENSGVEEISWDNTVAASRENWHYGACAFNDTAAELVSYFDGAIMATEPTVATIPDTTANVLIANRNTASSGFQGMIDVVHFYDRPLTIEELEYQYETLRP